MQTRRIWTILLAGAVVIASLAAARHYLSPTDREEAAIRNTVHHITPILANEIPPLLRAKDGKITMLVVYAAWCPYCRHIMPEIVTLLNGRKLDRFNRVFLSEDTRFRQLGAYLVQNNYADLFKPYLLKQSQFNSLTKALKSSGSHYHDMIPYIGFFDAQGKLVAETDGVIDKDRLLATIPPLQ